MYHVGATSAYLVKILGVVLLATCASSWLSAATQVSPQLAIYYSFDGEAAPPVAIVTEMQSELSRILAPTGLDTAWRSIDAPRNGADDFPGVVLIRFHGTCFFDAAPKEDFELNTARLTLAQTEQMDGRVIPFGSVNCDLLKRFIAPVQKFPDIDHKNAALGRALARVVAHEIYHMVTESGTHANAGIQRSGHSPTDLTQPTFTFAAAETNRLRDWAEKASTASQSGELQTVARSTALQSAEPETPGSSER